MTVPRRAVVTLVLLLSAGAAAVPPARAQRDERREQRREAPRLPRTPPERRRAVKPHRSVQPHRRPPAGSHRAPRSGQARRQPRPGRELRTQPAPGRKDWTRPRPFQRERTPGRKDRTGGSPAGGRLPKPRPVTDPKRFPHRWTPPPEPKAGAGGSPLTATPSPRPRHGAVLGNPRVVTRIISNQQNETEPNRYYWHHDGGFDYVHCYRGGVHWYGFYVGPHYYWSQYRANRWWWFDPVARRYLYFHGGYWWWQDPVNPAALYVYQNDGYVSYETAVAEAGAQPDPAAADDSAAPALAPAAPAAPAYHSDVDVPNYSLDPRDDSFALVIGVEDYAGLPKAEFAARDAQAVRAHLAALGYPDRNVVLLVSSQAARASIAKYVESWLPDRVTERSRVFVYFSGHGAPDPKTGAAYLMPWDGDAKYLANTGYPLKRLYASLNALPAKQIVVVLDSCFSGEGGRSVLVAGARPLVTKVDTARGSAGKAVVFAAAGADEITGVMPDQGHGLFTYWFLKGLNGGAPQTGDGVTVQGLFDYLAPNVEDAARRDNRDQTPQLLVPPDGQRGFLIKDLR